MVGLRNLPVRFCLLAAVLVVINVSGIVWIHHSVTAHSLPVLRVLAALPEGEVDRTDRFTLMLDKPIALPDAVGKSDPNAPFIIDPAPKGQWVWAAPDRLEYVLEERLLPGKRYTIEPALNMEAKTGRRLVGDSKFCFDTKRLSIEDCRVSLSESPYVRIEFVLSHAALPSELRNFCRLSDADGYRTFRGRTVSSDRSDHIELQIWEPDCDRLLVEVREPFFITSFSDMDAEPYSKVLDIHPEFTLMRAYASTPSLTHDAHATLYFSRKLNFKQRLPDINVHPEVADLRAAIRSDNTIRLEGSFKAGHVYSAEVSAGVLAESGDRLEEDQTVVFSFSDFSPEIRFPMSRGILMPNGNMSMDIESVGVTRIGLSAWRVHANNVAQHLRGEGPAATSRMVHPMEETALDLDPDQPARMAVDLESLLCQAQGGEAPLGIYRVRAQASGSYWSRDSAVVTVSDLSITTKAGRGDLMAWVTSLCTGQPVEGVNLDVLTYNNQSLGSGITDADGVALIKLPLNHPDGEPWLVTASKGRDLNYQLMDRNPWVFDENVVAGRAIPDSYDVMLYAERGVYRPGDTVHLTGIIRDVHGNTPPAFPLEIAVIRPDGRKVKTLTVTMGRSTLQGPPLQRITEGSTTDGSAAGGSVDGVGSVEVSATAGSSAEGFAIDAGFENAGRQGIFHTAYTSWDQGQTGPYRFVATLPGSSDVIGETRVYVEAFEPVRMEVVSEPSKPCFVKGEAPVLHVDAQYLFGRPAAGLPVALSGTFRKRSFKSESFPDYSFGSEKVGAGVPVDVAKTKLDPNGTAILALDVGKLKTPALWQGSVVSTVTEHGGRSVSHNQTVLVDTSGRHVGLRLRQGVFVPAGEQLDLDWVVRTTRDEPADPGELGIALFRIDWDSTLERVDGSYVWKSVERPMPVWDCTISEWASLKAGGHVNLFCPDPGHYRVVAKDKASGSETRLDFHASSDGSAAQSMAMNQPERIEIICDRDRYAPGSAATLMIRSPFAGTLLVTVETDRVIEYKVGSMLYNSAQITVPVGNEMRGSAFVTAMVVRPIEPGADQWLPVRAFGMARLNSDNAPHRMPVSIDAPEKAEPGSLVRVTVKAGASAVNLKKNGNLKKMGSPHEMGDLQGAGVADIKSAHLRLDSPARVHLWAVDEGILLTTGFTAPDPTDHFLAPRRLEVKSSDLFTRLLPDYKRPASMARIGADGDPLHDDAERLRRSPVQNPRREAVVVWRTMTALGPDGTYTTEITLPEHTGALRWMAVAVDGDCYGSAESTTTMTSPLLVEASWPRFVAPGDTFRVPVKVFNTTGELLDVEVSLDIEGPLEVSEKTVAVGVDPTRPETVWFSGSATAAGEVRVTTRARAWGLEALHEAGFVCRPVTPIHAESEVLTLEAGQSITLEPSDAYMPGTASMEISVGAGPDLHLRPALEKLMQYPYGCVEQTTSRLMALLHTPQLLREENAEARAQLAERMVRAGIRRLGSMQTRSGGLSYWPGGTVADLWGTAYAARFLSEAKKAGHALEPRFIKGITRYLGNALDGDGYIGSEGYNDSDACNLRAFLCAVLAELEKPPQSWMVRLSQRSKNSESNSPASKSVGLKILDVAGRAHLASAWLAAGNREKALAVLQDDMLETVVGTKTKGRITSQVRQDAVLLSTLIDIDAAHAWIPVVVNRLEAARSQGCWGTTVDNAGALSALTRYQLLHGDQEVNFSGLFETGAGTATKGGVAFDHTQAFSRRVNPDEGPVTLSTSGEGAVFVTATVEGMKSSGEMEPYDRRLAVRRTWRTPEGELVNPADLKVGDLIHVEVNLERLGTVQGSIHNIAVVDALPGGMEVENPRLITSAAGGWADDEDESDEADRVEFLDDRVVLFSSASRNKRTFRYALRVISAGTFAIPPVQASCMYDPSYASLHGGGEAKVCL